MEDKLIRVLIEWLGNWRSANSVPDGELLSGELLERFVGELQGKILSETGGFGPTVKGFADLVSCGVMRFGVSERFAPAA